MLSSKMSHTAVLQLILLLSSVAWGRFDDTDDVDVTVDRDWPNEDLDATPVHLGDADGVVGVLDTDAVAAAETVAGSTSTTRNTALPSITFRTLSASQSRDKEDEEEGDPMKASQTALPNLRRTVWLASCCSLWDDDSEEDELAEKAEEYSEAPVLGKSKGEGGVGYAEDKEEFE